jgi:hypothetical protein
MANLPNWFSLLQEKAKAYKNRPQKFICLISITPRKTRYENRNRSTIQFKYLTAIWKSSVYAIHHLLLESDITVLYPLLLNAYLSNIKVITPHDEAKIIYVFWALMKITSTCCLLMT